MYSPFFMVFFFKFDMNGECTVQVIGVLQLHMILLTTPNRCNEDCENTFYLLVISNRDSPVLGISMKLILMKLNTIKKFVHYKGIYSYITSCKATKYLSWYERYQTSNIIGFWNIRYVNMDSLRCLTIPDTET